MNKNPNALLLERFYEAFRRCDAATMAASYHPECTFSDPVFKLLKGEEVGAMWRMLCSRARDLKLEFSDIEAGNDTGRAHWEARYTFSLTGLPVHNVIEAAFTFRDGLILRHVDRFDLWRWAGQAMGVKGKLFGRLPLVQEKIRVQAMRGLEKFMKEEKQT
jgi:ketosteroid isomerase-like protein